MVHGEKRIPYWIDRRLTGLAGPEYHAIISFGLPIEPEDSQYGKYRLKGVCRLGYVLWYPFVDLDDDNWPDTNERLSDGVLYSEVDRLGNADITFWVDPETYFAERDLDVPDEMTVGIRAELYWSDPIEPRVARRAEVETTITTPSE